MEERDHLFSFIMLVWVLKYMAITFFLVCSLFFDKRNYYVTIILMTTLVSAWMKIITNVISALTGQRNRELAKTWSYRRMCNKPLEPKVESPPSTVSEHRALVFVYRQHYILNQGCQAICSFLSCSYCTAPRASFKVPGYRPSEMDRKILLWSGRYKTADQIPEFVS